MLRGPHARPYPVLAAVAVRVVAVASALRREDALFVVLVLVLVLA
jgi:hypothetical protein